MKLKQVIAALTCAAAAFSWSVTGFADNVNSVVGDGNTVLVFTDVPQDHWARDQIDSFVKRGIVNGYDDGTFRPDEGVTREEFCKLLVTTFNQSVETPTAVSFSDVASDRWSYPYIEYCRDFLTGYVNPFGGNPAFHPDEYATREDITVALVRMMGYTDSDAENDRYALENFRDGSSISPGLVGYVSLACEMGLVNGYGDGTFAPTKGVTRAETVALLNRATKQAVTTIDQELDVSANIAYNEGGRIAIINIKAEKGTSVTVNGESVKLETSGDYYIGSYNYRFDSEGVKNFVVEAKKAGKTKTMNLTAEYSVDVPVLSITDCPSTSRTNTATIRGTVYDSKYSVSLTINGEYVPVYSGQWSKTVSLSEGTNKFKIVASNAGGKQTSQEKSISYRIDGPELDITSCPTSVSTNKVTIQGTLSDSNYSVYLTINGEAVSVYGGQWSKTFTLSEGENRFNITATNSAGKSVSLTRTVSYTIGGPALSITNCPTSASSKSVTISGTVTDENYGVTLTVNGESVTVGSNGQWSKTITLDEGQNNVEIVATNSQGKTDKEDKIILFSADAPKLNVTDCPSVSTSRNITVKGTLKDDYSASLTVNGESISVGSNGQWSKTISLNEGQNKLVFVASNSEGKSDTVEKTVTFTAKDPEFSITDCPSSTNDSTVTIKGTLIDDSFGTELTVNGESISVGSNGQWSKKVSLSEGENEFMFVASNSAGKRIVQTRVITLNVAAPTIGFTDCPEVSYSSDVTIKGRITGGNSGAALFVNGDEVSVKSDGSFSFTYALNEGGNSLSFNAVNSAGKSASLVKNIIYVP